MILLEHGDIQWMTFTDHRCTHPSGRDFKYVTRGLEKQLGPKWCDLCHIFYGQVCNIKKIVH